MPPVEPAVLPNPAHAWVSVFRATGATQPTMLHALLATPGFDPCAIADGWTLPWAALGPLDALGALWKGEPPATGMEALLEALVEGGAPWRALHPVHGFDLLDVAVATNLPRLLARILALPDAPSAPELEQRRTPARRLAASRGTVALPWLHACLQADREDVFSVLIAHGLSPNQPDDQGWTPLFRATREAGVRTALAAGADPDVQVSGRPLALHAWLHLPTSQQTAFRGALKGTTAAAPLTAEDAFEMLASNQPESIKTALALLKALPPEARVPAGFSRTTADGTWGPLGWVAQAWWRRWSQTLETQYELSRQFSGVVRGLRRTIADRAFWQHPSLPGVPDGALAAGLLLAHANPNLGNWTGTWHIADCDYEKVFALALTHKRGQLGSPDPRVWQILEAVQKAMDGLEGVPRALNAGFWPRLGLRVGQSPPTQWPWLELGRVLAGRRGREVWERLPWGNSGLKPSAMGADPSFWDALVVLAEAPGAPNTAWVGALQMAQTWLEECPSVLDGVEQRPLFPQIRRRAQALPWPELRSRVEALALGKAVRTLPNGPSPSRPRL